MFTLIRLTIGIALMAYVGSAALGAAKDRFVNHDPDWYRTPLPQR